MITGIETTADGWARDTRACLRRLDPGQSRVLQMVYFEHLRHDEIAARLSISRAAVARRVAMALQALAVSVLPTE